VEVYQSLSVCPSGKNNMKMSMEHWWNNTDRGKAKYSEKNLPPFHCVHDKYRMDLPRIEPGRPL